VTRLFERPEMRTCGARLDNPGRSLDIFNQRKGHAWRDAPGLHDMGYNGFWRYTEHIFSRHTCLRLEGQGGAGVSRPKDG
jgi:hypothetical protein